MDPMSEHLARTIITARLADADQRRLGRAVEDGRRAERRTRRRLAVARWRQRIAARRTAHGASHTLAMAAAAPARQPSAELAGRLDAAAHRNAERGTASERPLLEAMHDVIAASAPGTAAALVDPDGSEASRLRAFGVAHTHLVDELGPCEHAWLLDVLDGGSRERAGLVA
jgi:hypothetical protein